MAVASSEVMVRLSRGCMRKLLTGDAIGCSRKQEIYVCGSQRWVRAQKNVLRADWTMRPMPWQTGGPGQRSQGSPSRA